MTTKQGYTRSIYSLRRRGYGVRPVVSSNYFDNRKLVFVDALRRKKKGPLKLSLLTMIVLGVFLGKDNVEEVVSK